MPVNQTANRRRGRRKKILVKESTGLQPNPFEEVHFEDNLFIVVYDWTTHYLDYSWCHQHPNYRFVLRRHTGGMKTNRGGRTTVEKIKPIVFTQYGRANNVAIRLNKEYETTKFTVKKVAIKDFSIEQWNVRNTTRQRNWWRAKRAEKKAREARHKAAFIRLRRKKRFYARRKAVVVNMEKRILARMNRMPTPRIQPPRWAFHVKIDDYEPMPKEFFRVIRRRKGDGRGD